MTLILRGTPCAKACSTPMAAGSKIACRAPEAASRWRTYSAVSSRPSGANRARASAPMRRWRSAEEVIRLSSSGWPTSNSAGPRPSAVSSVRAASVKIPSAPRACASSTISNGTCAMARTVRAKSRNCRAIRGGSPPWSGRPKAARAQASGSPCPVPKVEMRPIRQRLRCRSRSCRSSIVLPVPGGPLSTRSGAEAAMPFSIQRNMRSCGSDAKNIALSGVMRNGGWDSPKWSRYSAVMASAEIRNPTKGFRRVSADAMRAGGEFPA